MATVPTPRTWTVAELLTAAKMNTDVRNGLNLFITPPMAILRKSGPQGIPNAVHTVITFDLEDLDREGGHSTLSNTGRYTAQTAGWYHLVGNVTFAANATGWRDVMFQKNGNAALRQNRCGVPGLSGGGDTAVSITGQMWLSVGDYAEIVVYQTSGGNLNAITSAQDSRFEVRWVSAA